MTKSKTNLVYITNDSVRKLSFNKRKKGFFKKLHELSVLCDIQACAVIYDPFTSTPEVWPSNSEMKSVVEKFEGLPVDKQEKNMLNLESYLTLTVTKTRENTIKKIKDNTERVMHETMCQFLRGNGGDFQLNDINREELCMYIDDYLKELYHFRDQMLHQSHREYGKSSAAANAMTQQPAAIAEEGSSSFPNPDAFNTSHLVNQNMMNNPNPVRFPMMDDNNHHQP